MITDPVATLTTTLREAIRSRTGKEPIAAAEIAPHVPWRPHLFEDVDSRAWHVLTELPDSERWVRRIQGAQEAVPSLKVGIAAPAQILSREEVIDVIDKMEARVLPVEEADEGFRPLLERASILDMIYEDRWRLSSRLASGLLDRSLERALANRDSYQKGALLELLVAVLLSQVEGFEVSDRNISSATQEIDINVINRNTGGLLGGGAIVLAEAKNWSMPVDRKEYNAFAAKLRTRRGMAKLGFIVTTNRFTKPCYLEHLGERYMDDLVVLLDQERLSSIWRMHSSVTEGIERMVISAIYDHQ
jgi:hypothetical protein